MKRSCKRHASWHEGPRVPLRWGSAPTQVCNACGWWRLDHHGFKSMWRSPAALVEALEEDENV